MFVIKFDWEKYLPLLTPWSSLRTVTSSTGPNLSNICRMSWNGKIEKGDKSTKLKKR